MRHAQDVDPKPFFEVVAIAKGFFLLQSQETLIGDHYDNSSSV
jgi:hypothetical protein